MRVEWFRLRVFVVAGFVLGAGCLLSPQPDPPGGHDGTGDGGTGGDTAARDDGMGADARDGGDVGAETGADADSDAPADGVDGGNYDDECPTDPDDGPTGEPCNGSDDCESGFLCVPEYVGNDGEGGSWSDFVGGYCVPETPPAAPCLVGDDSSCPVGASCVPAPAGTDPASGFVGRCLDACSVADAYGLLYPANCDCRSGYRCDLNLEVCVPGCLTDADCCVEWLDGNADGVRQADELAPVAECAAVCDLRTARCSFPGTPDAELGESCWHTSECPADSRCWALPGAERQGLPGLCLRERCDLAGRACPEGTACAAGDPALGLRPFCARPCTVAAPPGEPGATCVEGSGCVEMDYLGVAPADGACLPSLEGR